MKIDIKIIISETGDPETNLEVKMTGCNSETMAANPEMAALNEPIKLFIEQTQ